MGKKRQKGKKVSQKIAELKQKMKEKVKRIYTLNGGLKLWMSKMYIQ